MQPGETITPGPEQPPQPPVVNEVPPTPPTPPAPQVPEQTEPAGEWQFTPDANTTDQSPNIAAQAANPVSWTASEFVSHRKGFSWFVTLGLGLFVLVAIVYLLTQDIFASLGVSIAGIAFAAFSVRPPRVLNYTIDEKGIQIGQRFYGYNDFKSFSILQDGAFPSVLLMPLKRFLPPITLFCEPQSADAIIDALSAYLPHETREPDLVDKLMGHLRF